MEEDPRITPCTGEKPLLGPQSSPARGIDALGDRASTALAKSLLFWIRDACARHSDRVALRFRRGDEWDSLSYSALLRRVSEVALGLRAAGVTKDDRVLIMSGNAPEVLVTELATIANRAVSVVISPSYAPSVLPNIIAQVAPRVAVVESGPPLARYLDARERERRRMEDDRIRVVSFGDGVPGPRGRIASFQSLAMEGRRRLDRAAQEKLANPFDQLADRTRAQDPIAIAYSSGTTRAPRGAMLTHDNVVVDRLSDLFGPFAPEDVALIESPLAQPFVRLCVCYGVLLSGRTLAFAESNRKLLRTIQEVEPTLLFLSPSVLRKLELDIKRKLWHQRLHGLVEWGLDRAQHARAHGRERPPRLVDWLVLRRIRANLGGRLRLVYTGGGPADGDLLSFFQNVGIDTYEGYSLAEATPLVALHRPQDNEARFGAGIVGRPISGVEVKLEGAEICVRGLANMKGYWRGDRDGAIDAGGWLHTGDVGHVDGNGFVRLEERRADVIRLACGACVLPSAVEEALKGSPLVREAVVLGEGRPFPIALIVPDFRELARRVHQSRPELARSATRRDLLSNPASRVAVLSAVMARSADLPAFARPRDVRLLAIDLSEASELTPSGTLRRRAIEEKFAVQIEALYAALASEAAPVGCGNPPA